VGQCEACGNVNPEQIFNIIEAKIVDEYGHETDQRRIGPDAWNEVFRAQMECPCGQGAQSGEPAQEHLQGARQAAQMAVFFLRDVVSKLVNRQYVLINLLQAPLLALVMAFFLRYAGTGADGHAAYVYRHNDNIPQYLFIAVIVALFLGLTVAAEEIIRDRKILQREKFLSLSRTQLPAQQDRAAVHHFRRPEPVVHLGGRPRAGFSGLTWNIGPCSSASACFANVLGLNVSASFNSAKVIYIMIPVLIIPQLLFSGIIVRFDKLHPWFASRSACPGSATSWPAAGPMKALAVSQFCDNAYEKHVLRLRQRMKTSNWKKDLWVRELQERSGDRSRSLEGKKLTPRNGQDLALIQREMGPKNAGNLNGFTFRHLDR
jgi:hypothetical protein